MGATNMTRRDWLVVVSPFPLIAVCRSIELLETPLGTWVWVPAMLVFWFAIAVLVRYGGSSEALACWLRTPRRPGSWCGLAVAVGLLSLPEFIGHWRVLLNPGVMIAWVLFALVNPLFEEAYWRGLLLDATASWRTVPAVAYSAFLFAASHPLIWGVRSEALRDLRVVPVLAMIGVVWAMAYRRTGSLVCSVVGHACANLLGMSVPLLLNLYSPLAR
jgi:membrane protease YdiL (CAAX protease family)